MRTVLAVIGLSVSIALLVGALKISKLLRTQKSDPHYLENFRKAHRMDKMGRNVTAIICIAYLISIYLNGN